MKTFCLITIIALFLFLCINGIQAQTKQEKIDQIEFSKQFLGSWKAEIGKDTVLIYNSRPFGNSSERDFNMSTNGRIFYSGKELFGYDGKNDKMIEAALYESSPNLSLWVWWATSKNTSEGVPLENISNPENSPFKMQCEIKSPDSFMMRRIAYGKVVTEWTFIRIQN